MKTVLTISDLHLPYEHPDALEFILELHKYYKPDIIISMGDILDQYFFTRFAKDPLSMSYQEELGLVREKIQHWYEAFPNLLICLGNHDVRYLKRGLEMNLPSDLFKDVNDIYGVPDTWQWAPGWVIDGVRYFHGEPYSGIGAARNMLIDRPMNQVHGHLHTRAGTTYRRTGDEAFWVLSTGCLIDLESVAFAYEAKNRERPIIGTGVIVDGIPIFEPL